jgi:chemotaxis protein CheX
MNRDYLVNSIVEAVGEVFTTMLDISVERGEEYLVRGTPGTDAGVVSLVGLAGAWAGTGSVSCSPAFACEISSRMLMMEFPTVNEDVLDAMAEVTNMVMGSVKTRLEETLGPMGLSIPTVIYGQNFMTRVAWTQEWVVVPFRWRDFCAEVKVFLAPAPDRPGSRPASSLPLAARH